jgi:ABC-type transport system substrate-binding protein
MRRWSPELIGDEFDRRKFLKGGTLAATGLTAGLAGCSGGGGEGGADTDSGGGGGGGGGSTETEASSDSDSDMGGGGPSGTLTMSIAAEPWNMDYALYQDTGTGYIVDSIYDNLITYKKTDDGNLALEPLLATDMPMVSDDLQTYEFDIREGVMFHGGEKEMTAQDAAYSMNWLLEEPSKNVTGFVKPYVENAEAVDDYTVRFNLKQPWGLLPEYMTRVYRVVRQGAHGDIGDFKGPTGQSSKLTRGPRLDMEASTGPWYVEEWASGSQITLKAHEDYWMENTPKIETIRFEITPETSTKLSALRSGDSDMLDQVPPKDYESLSNQPGINTDATPGLKTEVIYFNNQSGIFGGEDGQHLRRAVNFAIDRKAVVQQIFYGLATPQWGPIWPSKFVPDDLKYENQEFHQSESARQEAVQAELDAAGMSDGFSFECIATQAQWFVDMGNLIAGQLTDYGIEMNVKPMKKASVFDIVYGGPSAPYEAAIEDYGIPMPVPEYWLDDGYMDIPNHLRWLTDENAPGGETTTQWVSEYIDTVNAAIQASDEETRMENLAKAQRTTVETAGQANIAYVQLSRAWRDRVKNYPGPYQNNKQEFRPVSLE